MRRIASLLFAFCFASSSHGDVVSVLSGPTTPVVAIDETTGARRTIVATNDSLIHGDLSTFDPIGRRLFFVSAPGTQRDFYTANIATGVLTSVRNRNPPSEYALLEYDQATGRVIALAFSGGRPLISIDPATGQSQTLFNTNSLSGGTVIGVSAFDPATRRLFFFHQQVPMITITAFLRIVTADLDTGQVTEVTTPFNTPFFLEFDPQTNRLLTSDGNSFFLLDPETGLRQNLGPVGPFIAFGVATYNPATRVIYYKTGPNQTGELVSVALPGMVERRIPIPLPPGNSFKFFEFDPSADDGPGIPALDARALIALVLVIAAVAMLTLRR